MELNLEIGMGIAPTMPLENKNPMTKRRFALSNLHKDDFKGKFYHIKNNGNLSNTHFAAKIKTNLLRKSLSELENSGYALSRELNQYYQNHGIVDDDLFACGQYIPNFESVGYVYYCGKAVCPICDTRKKRKFNLLCKKVDKYLQNKNMHNHLMTVIFPDIEDGHISKLYEEVQKGLRKLTNSRIFKRSIAGFVRAWEFVVTDLGLYHCHLHILLAFKMLFEGKTYPLPITEDGKEYTCPALEAHIKETLPDVRKVHFAEPYYKSLLAVFVSYVSKLPKNITPQEWLVWKTSTANKRLLTVTGIFREALAHCRNKRRVCHA